MKPAMPGTPLRRLTDEDYLPWLQVGVSFVLIAALVLALGWWFIADYRREVERRIDQLERETLAQQETLLRRRVDETRIWLDWLRSRAETLLAERVREQAEAAYELVYSMHRLLDGPLGTAETQKLIVETLRPLRFFDGRGYYFIDTLDGDCVLLPTSPEREGHSLLPIRDDNGVCIMCELIRVATQPEGAGLLRYRWYPPNDATRMDDKLTWVRRFEPYHWLLGTGEYLDTMMRMLQREALDRLRALRFEDDGYIAVFHRDGRMMVTPANPDLEGSNGRTTLDATRRAVLEQLLASAGAGGGVVRYDWNRPAGGPLRTKLSVVTPFDAWGWTLVAGLYLDDLDVTLASQRGELEAGVRARERATLWALALALSVGLGSSIAYARWVQARLRARRRELEASARRLYLTQRCVDAAADSIFLADADLCVVYANDAACRTLGRPAAAIAGRSLSELGLAPPGMPTQPDSYEATPAGPEGRSLALEVAWTPLETGGERYACAIARDVAERKRVEAELRLASLVFEIGNDAMMITDADNRILAVNPAFTRVTGYAPAEVIGRNPNLLSSGRQPEAFYAALWNALARNGHWSGELWNRRKDGSAYPQWLSISVLRDASGRAVRHVAAFTDISERKANEARIRHLADYDPLTDLPNRTLLRERIQQTMHAAASGGPGFALVFLDLDHFKHINDTLGHAAGDALLCAVGTRLRSVVRSGDTVSRTGGDEFVLLLPGLVEAADTERLTAKLMRTLAEPYLIGGKELRVTPSLGYACYPHDATDIDTLLGHADAAMYQAKAQGRNNAQPFTPRLSAHLAERFELENALRGALERQELELHYQPQYFVDGRPRGAEALLRWQHPQLGRVSPERFIPIAEETGLIRPIGDWVLRSACAQAVAWQRAGIPPLTIAVNVSAVQFAQADWVDTVAATLGASGLAPCCLQLELTESVLMKDPAAAALTLKALRATGVRLSIDDFGTGYSSLAYLKRFPLDELKIDRSFIDGLPGDAEDAAIVHAILQLARSLGLETVAEGVETEAQRRFLQAHGCTAVQGWLYAPALPAGAAGERLHPPACRASGRAN